MAGLQNRRIGPYEIGPLIGEGGMGQVYRAHDTKLNRDVAIKVLPQAFVTDPERVARFQREAQVLASLSHPNIGHIYGFEDADGVGALVLELIEGPTLAERLTKGSTLKAQGSGSALPLDEALPIARQIADALEAAHDKGIVHRDLKPSNIKVRPDGTVKVLDFGLAKLLASGAGSGGGAAAGLTHSPTMLTASMPGMIVGTAAYMAPEQAKGKDADRTADIWAFGCVLYEMLAGRALFKGDTVSEVLADVLKTDPDWTRLPADTPESLRRLLRRCLQKDPKKRLQHIGDARIEIDEPESASPAASGSAAVPRARERRAVGLVAASLVVAAGAVATSIWLAVRPAPAPATSEMRFEITTPPTPDPVSLAISPDGQKLVFVGTSDGQSLLWLRSLDAVSARPLPGTDGARFPFWSQDSRSVGFSADGKLKRIDVDGGSAQPLANGEGAGGTWNRDNLILFSNLTGPIFRISAAGGEATAVTRPDASRQSSHRFPQFLPDGRHFLFFALGTPEARGVYLGGLDGSEPRRLFDADSAAFYAAAGQLLFVRQGTLLALPFDPVRLALDGNPHRVADQVATSTNTSSAIGLSTSAAGPIVYRSASTGGHSQFVWFDRSGQKLGVVGDADTAGSAIWSLSPDGRRVAMQRLVNGKADIWLFDTTRGALTRFTSDAWQHAWPVWSPDGKRIVYVSNAKGTYDLYSKSSSGAGSEDLLLGTPDAKYAMDWSADGRFLLYRTSTSRTGNDVWALPLNGDKRPFPVVQTDFDEGDGQFSPDGKWIAYQSNETGRFEIYVQPFPGPGSKSRISTAGGAQVRWGRDGKELFYIALDGRLMAVPIRLSEQSVDVGVPVSLFATHVGGAIQTSTQQYAVAPDGRFLMNTVTEEAAAPITVILNWKPRQ